MENRIFQLKSEEEEEEEEEEEATDQFHPRRP